MNKSLKISRGCQPSQSLLNQHHHLSSWFLDGRSALGPFRIKHFVIGPTLKTRVFKWPQLSCLPSDHLLNVVAQIFMFVLYSTTILTKTHASSSKDISSLCSFLFFSEKCDEPLVSGLPHGAFSSSSSTSGSYSPGYAKINKRGGKAHFISFVNTCAEKEHVIFKTAFPTSILLRNGY